MTETAPTRAYVLATDEVSLQPEWDAHTYDETGTQASVSAAERRSYSGAQQFLGYYLSCLENKKVAEARVYGFDFFHTAMERREWRICDLVLALASYDEIMERLPATLVVNLLMASRPGRERLNVRPNFVIRAQERLRAELSPEDYEQTIRAVG